MPARENRSRCLVQMYRYDAAKSQQIDAFLESAAATALLRSAERPVCRTGKSDVRGLFATHPGVFPGASASFPAGSR